MLTGFEIDTKAKSLPFGVRILVSLMAKDESPFTVAILTHGVEQDFYSAPVQIKPYPADEISVQATPLSIGHRYIINLPEEQRIFVGDFPNRVAFEITVQRFHQVSWFATNRVLAIFDGSDCKMFQAKEFAS